MLQEQKSKLKQPNTKF